MQSEESTDGSLTRQKKDQTQNEYEQVHSLTPAKHMQIKHQNIQRLIDLDKHFVERCIPLQTNKRKYKENLSKEQSRRLRKGIDSFLIVIPSRN